MTPGQEQQGALSSVSLPASVPATPSLLNALHRVAAAQRQAYRSQPELPGITSDGDRGHGILGGLPIFSEPNRGGTMAGAVAGEWDEFWKDVKAQARTPIRQR